MALALAASLFLEPAGVLQSPSFQAECEEESRDGTEVPCRSLSVDDNNENHYILVIHGTFDSPNPNNTPLKWYFLDPSNPSNFCSRLHEELTRAIPELANPNPIWRPIPTEKMPPEWKKDYPFFWDGSNTHKSRMEAAGRLAKVLMIMTQVDPAARVHIIAHSHGGNVVLKALELYMAELANEPDTKWPPIIRRRFWQAYHGPHALVARWRAVRHVRVRALWPLSIVYRRYNGDKSSGPERYCFGLYRWFDSFLGLGHFRQRTYVHHRKASSPLTNVLGKIVFMGTPFYVKQWTKGGRFWLTVHVIAVTIVACIFLFLYSTFLLYVFIGRVMDWTSTWSWVVRSAFGGGLILTVTLGIPVSMLQDVVFSDGNFYNNSKYEWTAAMSGLVINAGMLDEAALALSTKPVVEAFLIPQLRELFTATMWKQWPPPPPHLSLPQVTKYICLAIGAIYINSIFIFPILLQRALVFILLPYFGKQLQTLIVSLAYGLKPLDLNYAAVHCDLSLRLPAAPDVYHWDVQRLLICQEEEKGEKQSEFAGEEPEGGRGETFCNETKQKYSFLWTDEELNARAEQSITYQGVKGKLSTLKHDSRLTDEEFERELKCICVMTEARLYELFGRHEFSHSLYFKNRAVLAGIVEFLASRPLPEWTEEADDREGDHV